MIYPKICLFFLSKQTDLSSDQGNLARNLKFLIDNLHVSRISRLLMCNINTPLCPSIDQ